MHVHSPVMFAKKHRRDGQAQTAGGIGAAYSRVRASCLSRVALGVLDTRTPHERDRFKSIVGSECCRMRQGEEANEVATMPLPCRKHRRVPKATGVTWACTCDPAR